MKLLKYTFIFLAINFGSLAIGSILMDDGPKTNWYLNLNKAPWTPSGWVFGFAWSTIMICYSFYMAYLFSLRPSTKVKILFASQFFLNFIWNYIFFNLHLISLGFILILLLTIIIGIFLYSYKNLLGKKNLLIIPYFFWLLLASSLNLYILLYN